MDVKQDDIKIVRKKKQKLRPYDALLKSFQYADALDSVLSTVR